MENYRIAFFHGSPEKHTEFLFPFTPVSRFKQLARSTEADIIITGHSHIPYHKIIADTHFINPGSVGRMFDGDPSASFAMLTLEAELDDAKGVRVDFYRCVYDIEQVVERLAQERLPKIYAAMYRQGRKLS